MREIYPLIFRVTHLEGSTCPPSLRPRSSRYDTLDSSHRSHLATGQSRHNHSPYSEPTVLIAPYESVSPDSQASFSPSITDSPNTRSHPQSIAVPPSHAPAGAGAGAITSASGARLSSQMTPFINSTPGDPRDAKTVGETRGRTPPTRKRKASEMLGGSPGSEDRAISPEPSESEAKKKYKKKMNVRHYRAQNKDAMTQLRDALPEHMRPPERQAKAYVTLSGTS